MECETAELWCQLTTLAAEHFHTALVATNNLSSEDISQVTEIIATIASVIVALFSISFALYKYWRYNERTMHLRLAEYLKKGDKRLEESQIDFCRVIRRPRPGLNVTAPYFVNEDLRDILAARNWRDPWSILSVERGADKKLVKALSRIDEKIDVAQDLIRSLQHQKKSANLLRGVIASAAPASREWHEDNQSQLALTHIRNARKVKGHSDDLIAMELEALELQKLFRLDDAVVAFQELIEKLERRTQDKARDLMLARAKQSLIEIDQRRAIDSFLQGKQITAKSQNAAKKLAAEDGPTGLRNRHAPHAGWDAIDNAELNYLAALVCRMSGATNKEPMYLSHAESDFKSATLEISKWKLFQSRLQRKLFEDAEAGIRRVERARNEHVYDYAWVGTDLLKQPYQSPASVGSDANKDSVAKTAEEKAVN